MNRVALVCALLLLIGPSGSAAQPGAAAAPSPRNASYTLRATLDTRAHTIAGSGQISWRNISANPTTELRFHLYWNAWRGASSSWMREERLGLNARLADRPANDFASIDLTTLSLSGENLLAHAAFRSEDDGNTDDRTVLIVPLTKAVAPGEAVELQMAWTAHIPRPFARTGVVGDYYFIAQWFPKLGVLQDDGWNCHQFHAATEFFSDFGTYDVTLETPKWWNVGATGKEVGQQPDAGSGATSHHFVQDDVHDFAWTTSPDYLESHERFEEAGLPPVDMRLLLQKEHGTGEQIARHFLATRVALRNYGRWFGPYPYDHITIVDPMTIVDPAQGASTGGMEYPTLFTAGSRFLIPKDGLTPESVAIHEAGHQFWYGVVATNEFEHAWMDEGLNSFSQSRAIAEGLPAHFVAVDRYFAGLIPWAFADVPWSRDVDGGRMASYRSAAGYEVPSTPTWRYWPGSAAATTYSKTALWMATFEKYYGWPMLQRILSTYFARYRFQHPAPEQFFAVATEVTGEDLNWFVDAVYRSAATFDFGVERVVNVPTTAGFEDTVVVRNYADGVFPVDVRVTFADGSRVTERWSGKDRWHAYAYRKTTPVSSVEVDPDRVLLLDLNYTNNSWTSRPAAAAAAAKWSARWMMWMQEVLLSYAFFC